MRLIDADAAKEQIKRRENMMIPDDDGYKYLSTNALYMFMDNRPTVDAEPVKHGHWIWEGLQVCICSECECKNENPTPYCPWCGARLRGLE